MKTFKDLKTFENAVKLSTAWEDYFKVDGKTYKLYEYGGGSMMNMDYDYAYFLNKKTHDTIYIKYNLPSVNYVKGEKIVTGTYRLISLEFIPSMEVWRTDTI